MPLRGWVCYRSSKEVTAEEFKNWLKKFDADRDGRISKEELRNALRDRGFWFTTRKSRRGVGFADANGNGVIDPEEMDLLVDYARNHLGIKIKLC